MDQKQNKSKNSLARHRTTALNNSIFLSQRPFSNPLSPATLQSASTLIDVVDPAHLW